jgi:plastocyanin
VQRVTEAHPERRIGRRAITIHGRVRGGLLARLALAAGAACGVVTSVAAQPARAANALQGASAAGPRSAIFARAYQPSALTVAAGQSITWHNETLGPHTVTSLSELFDSGRLDANASFTMPFAGAGTFPYYCTVHPTMKGVVTVLAIPAEKVLLRVSSKRSAHGRRAVLHVEVARTAMALLIQVSPAGKSRWQTIARPKLGSQGTATVTLAAGSGPRRARVVVPAANGQPRLLSRAVRLPA